MHVAVSKFHSWLSCGHNGPRNTSVIILKEGNIWHCLAYAIENAADLKDVVYTQGCAQNASDLDMMCMHMHVCIMSVHGVYVHLTVAIIRMIMRVGAKQPQGLYIVS